jgi:putative membrane protein
VPRAQWKQVQPERCEETTMMGWYGHGGFGTSWMLMGAVWLLVLLALGWLVIRLVSGRHTVPVDPNGPTRAALELLDRRFALGEIDADAYRAQRAALLGETPVTR